MKLTSEGKVVFEMDEERIQKAASDPEVWRFEMLKAAIKNVTLNERLCSDHIEIKYKQDDNGKLLTKIATAIGILLALLTGATMVI